jgi:ABC-type branched-subunit amino acid transport system substrate-binding protein
MRTSSRYLATALLVTAVLAVPLAGSSGAKPASGDPLRFGFLDFTPAAAATHDGLQAYFDDWNKRGGYKGQPIELVYKSSDSLNSAGADAQTITNDPSVLAMLSGGVCQVTINALKATKIPTLASPALDPSCFDSSFMYGAGGQAPSLPALQWAIDHGSKHFGVLVPSVPGVSALVDPFKAYVDKNPQLGVDLTVVPLPLNAGGADVDGALAKLKSANVDAVFPITVIDTQELLLREAAAQGYGPTDGIKYIFSGIPTADLPIFEGTYALSVLYSWEDTSIPAVKKMVKTIGKKVKVHDSFSAGAYQEGLILEQTLDHIKGPITRDSIEKFWRAQHKFQLPLAPYKVDFVGGSGCTGINSGDACTFKSPSGAQILQNKDGTWVPAGEFVVIPAKEFN